jgi:hypothetical protein
VDVSKACPHDGFHDIRSTYDHRRGLLFFYWTCQSCGELLGEAERTKYRPRFERRAGDAAGKR